MKFGGLVLLNGIDIKASFFLKKWNGILVWNYGLVGSRFKQGANMEDLNLNLNSKSLWDPVLLLLANHCWGIWECLCSPLVFLKNHKLWILLVTVVLSWRSEQASNFTLCIVFRIKRRRLVGYCSCSFASLRVRSEDFSDELMHWTGS